MRPSPEWDLLLSPFASCFTAPGFRFFYAFVKVLAQLDGRLWVTPVILSGGLDRHFTGFYRFLREGAWSVEEGVHRLWLMVSAVCVTSKGRLFIAVDDTVCQKSGKKFFGLGVHHDPMNPDHPKQLSRGHCFVCLAALGQQGIDHTVAFSCGVPFTFKRRPAPIPFPSSASWSWRPIS